MGWEPEVRTDYVYDASGRVVSSVRFSEPEWDDEQRALALAFEDYRRDIGPNGELLSEATSDRADPNYYEADGIRYVSRGPHTNWAEKARMDAEEAYRKTLPEGQSMHGMFWSVEKL